MDSFGGLILFIFASMLVVFLLPMLCVQMIGFWFKSPKTIFLTLIPGGAFPAGVAIWDKLQMDACLAGPVDPEVLKYNAEASPDCDPRLVGAMATLFLRIMVVLTPLILFWTGRLLKRRLDRKSAVAAQEAGRPSAT